MHCIQLTPSKTPKKEISSVLLKTAPVQRQEVNHDSQLLLPPGWHRLGPSVKGSTLRSQKGAQCQYNHKHNRLDKTGRSPAASALPSLPQVVPLLVPLPLVGLPWSPPSSPPHRPPPLHPLPSLALPGSILCNNGRNSNPNPSRRSPPSPGAILFGLLHLFFFSTCQRQRSR